MLFIAFSWWHLSTQYKESNNLSIKQTRINNVAVWNVYTIAETNDLEGQTSRRHEIVRMRKLMRHSCKLNQISEACNQEKAARPIE